MERGVDRQRARLACLWALSCLAGPVVAQTGALDYAGRLGQQRGPHVTFPPQGPTVIMGAIDPARHAWYLPQDLYEEHRFRQWQTTRYAAERYERYVNPGIEACMSTLTSCR